MNVAFGPVMISTALWLGFFVIWCIVCFAQARRDVATGKGYADHSNA